jgi:hypothetical protein
MGLPVPSLDDRRYADLLDEARALVPVYDPLWTNHNASDPGITLLEMFAWLTEMLIYSLDQITDDHRITFLRLLNGPDWQPTQRLDQEISNGLDRVRERYRAVTVEDHEVLACQASPRVKRARCVPRRNLDAGTRELRVAPAAGHVSVVIVPVASGDDATALCGEVAAWLEPRRMLTTRLHVVPPTWVPIRTRTVVVRQSDSRDDVLAADIRNRLAAWLDPLTGGEGDGWPFGRPVYVSELNAVVEAVPGVDHLGPVTLSGAASAGDARRDSARPLWHDDGDLIGLGLDPHHLPEAPKSFHEVIVVDRLEPVRITVVATAKSAALEAELRRAVKETLNTALWSLQAQAAAEQKGFDLSVAGIRTALLGAAEVQAAASGIGAVTLEAEAFTLKPDADAVGAGDPAGAVSQGRGADIVVLARFRLLQIGVAVTPQPGAAASDLQRAVLEALKAGLSGLQMRAAVRQDGVKLSVADLRAMLLGARGLRALASAIGGITLQGDVYTVGPGEHVQALCQVDTGAAP